MRCCSSPLAVPLRAHQRQRFLANWRRKLEIRDRSFASLRFWPGTSNCDASFNAVLRAWTCHRRKERAACRVDTLRAVLPFFDVWLSLRWYHWWWYRSSQLKDCWTVMFGIFWCWRWRLRLDAPMWSFLIIAGLSIALPTSTGDCWGQVYKLSITFTHWLIFAKEIWAFGSRKTTNLVSRKRSFWLSQDPADMSQDQEYYF